MDDLITPFAEDVAIKIVDEQITRNPKLKNQRETLLQRKIAETKEVIDEVLDDFLIAFDYLKNWVGTLDKNQRQKVQQEFIKLGQTALTDDFFTALKKVLNHPTLNESPLQEQLQVPDEMIQKMYTLAFELQSQNDFVRSKALFRFLTLINPTLFECWVNYGFSCMNLGLMQEARKSFEQALKLNPENPHGIYFSAVCAFMQKDKARAHKLCLEGLERSDKDTTWKDAFLKLKNEIVRGDHGR